MQLDFFGRGVNRGDEGLDRRKNSPRWGRKFFLCQPLPGGGVLRKTKEKRGKREEKNAR